MSENNVIPFRKRPPSAAELEIYEQVTRNWNPEMRRLMFPEYFEHCEREQQKRFTARN